MATTGLHKLVNPHHERGSGLNARKETTSTARGSWKRESRDASNTQVAAAILRDREEMNNPNLSDAAFFHTIGHRNRRGLPRYRTGMNRGFLTRGAGPNTRSTSSAPPGTPPSQ